MNEFTPEQAALIHDIESYRAVMGAKRFKRTKEEMSLGLSPEEALQRRLTGTGPTPISVASPVPRSGGTGDVVIRIRPEKGVNPDYFEHLPAKPVEIVLDDKWYAWLDTKLTNPYDGNIELLVRHILDMGLGGVIDRYILLEDLQDELQN